MSVKKLVSKTTQIKNEAAKTELINEVFHRNNIDVIIKSVDDLQLNAQRDVSSVRISSAYYQRFLKIKEDLKNRGISISSQEFFDYILSQSFKEIDV